MHDPDEQQGRAGPGHRALRSSRMYNISDQDVEHLMPDDYGSDVYGQVEGPPDTPYDLVEFALAYECPDCNVNVFIEHEPYEVVPENWNWPEWSLKIAHDTHCPWLAELERKDDG